MVLIFSSSANTSKQIKREVERAVAKGVAIIPLRIEDVPLGKTLEYFISSEHWMDALSRPLEPHVERLAGAIRALLARPSRVGHRRAPRTRRRASRAAPSPLPPPPVPLAAAEPAPPRRSSPRPRRPAPARRVRARRRFRSVAARRRRGRGPRDPRRARRLHSSAAADPLRAVPAADLGERHARLRDGLLPRTKKRTSPRRASTCVRRRSFRRFLFPSRAWRADARDVRLLPADGHPAAHHAQGRDHRSARATTATPFRSASSVAVPVAPVAPPPAAAPSRFEAGADGFRFTCK